MALGLTVVKEIPLHLQPTVEAAESLIVHVVGRSEKKFFTIKTLEVMRQIINHIITMHDRLSTTEYKLFPMKEGEVLTQPLQFFI